MLRDAAQPLRRVREVFSGQHDRPHQGLFCTSVYCQEAWLSIHRAFHVDCTTSRLAADYTCWGPGTDSGWDASPFSSLPEFPACTTSLGLGQALER